MPFDESESEPLTEFDTENHTYFHPAEAPSEDRDKWKTLAGYNTGVYQRDWADKEKLYRMDNLALFDALAGQLDLTPYQKLAGRTALDRLPIREIGYGAEMIVFSVCAHYARQDGRVYHPRRKPENNDSEFQRIADDLAFNLKHVERCFLATQQALEQVTPELAIGYEAYAPGRQENADE